MTTYTAWDGNEYPLPTPDGWYFATDSRWWPEGHGPGPAVAVPAALSGMPSAAPPMGSPPGDAGFGSAPDTTIYSAPAPGSNEANALSASASSDSGGGNGKTLLVLGVVLLGLIAIGAGAFFALGSGDDDVVAVATTVFQTQQSDLDGAPATTTVGADDATSESTVAVAAGKGSLGDPYAVGEPIVVQYTDGTSGETRTWNIEVLAAASDITQAVLDENQFNDPPEGDQQFVGVPVRVTYVSGPAPASLFELTFKAVGPSGVVLTTFDPSCGVVPDALDTFAELFEGGAVEGSICWAASPADAADLTMLLEVFLDDTEIYADLGG